MEFRRSSDVISRGNLVAESQYVGCSLRVLLGPKFEYAEGGGGGCMKYERQIGRLIST